MDLELFADNDTLCCICHFRYKPGQKIVVYHLCNHLVHSRCYRLLRLSGFRSRCPLDNLKRRTVMKFRVDPSIVDTRGFEEEDEEHEALTCYFCGKIMDKVYTYKSVMCGGEYHMDCAWVAIGFESWYGEGCEVKLSFMADLKGRVRMNGEADDSTSFGSGSSSNSGSDAPAARAPKDGCESDLLFPMDP